MENQTATILTLVLICGSSSKQRCSSHHGFLRVESIQCFMLLHSTYMFGAQFALLATSVMAPLLTPSECPSSLIPSHFGSSNRKSGVQIPFVNTPDVFAQLVFIQLLRRKLQCVVPAIGAFLPLADWPLYGSNGGRGLNSSSGAYVSFRPRCIV